MQKYKIIYSDDARRDIQNIFKFVESVSSEANAKMVITRFIKKIRSFSVFPERNDIIGKDENGLLIRVTVSGKYRIIYTVKRDDREVVIIRVLSISQDPSREV